VQRDWLLLLVTCLHLKCRLLMLQAAIRRMYWQYIFTAPQPCICRLLLLLLLLKLLLLLLLKLLVQLQQLLAQLQQLLV